jgi:nitrogen fixation NifU-like protein
MSEAFAELRDLYQEVILDHGRHPRNFRRLDGALHAKGDNPMCGDMVEVWLKLGEGERIEDVSFQGRGCAISIASASLMTEVLRGKTTREALSGVADYPSRVKCATLAWHAMEAALKGEGSATTE